jgi:hypothetical protein
MTPPGFEKGREQGSKYPLLFLKDNHLFFASSLNVSVGLTCIVASLRLSFACLDHHHNIMVLFRLRNLSAADFLVVGLGILGYKNKRCNAMEIRRFRAHFGASPKSCSAIFLALQTTQIQAARVNKPDPFYFLMTMHWFSRYQVEESYSGAPWLVDEKTFQHWAWIYTHKIQALKGDKVSDYDCRQVATILTISN